MLLDSDRIETDRAADRDALRELRRLWPEYRKGILPAEQLRRRFDLVDLRRAARHDEELRKLLGALAL